MPLKALQHDGGEGVDLGPCLRCSILSNLTVDTDMGQMGNHASLTGH